MFVYEIDSIFLSLITLFLLYFFDIYILRLKDSFRNFLFFSSNTYLARKIDEFGNLVKE